MKSPGRCVRFARTPPTTCRPRMKRLIKSLQHFSVTSSEHVESFSKMTLRDFGFYVSDADAMRYVADEAYPIAERAFQLENALHQCRLSASTAQVSPMAWKSSSSDTLGCSTLYQDEAVTLCWFVLPPGKALPLHDHPGMTVWQRAMHGRLHLCSITREADSQTGTGASTAPINGTVVFDGELDGVGDAIPASDVLGFTPTDGDGGGMLHEIRNIDATQPALFVDIISPPYNQAPSNIVCGYYTAEPLDATATLLPALAADCGVRHQLKAGDKVRLHPRINYSGPAMNAFLHVV
ncbi:conserved hypothetical protein [Leishmania infantum JPCM5]|uniref:Protein_of_uncharacterized_function_(DUF1637)_-_p utative n=2 Tax=Leishmania infantum TaxID=5671 RepID=A0A6L0WSV3_LEIIN|nr:conserved hypothetical protein [Leishmania infantum JPCM5]CAC9447214.1 Protein_of_uncharacterised_function_(DUF1637)_-_putative [Leishmania infantum]CAM65558.1 conserved hypothetical protein [Leishmania infantum JPCM5]SUZ39174.1 Protein_of_uncharacterised_function_(DUF1637)_-_putative [Leishmania infantum]|eukprot:XP_001463205.1 conserved hypothetical protein [Leishmania infantum JPCM5]